mmetsp:Transcript_38408/g.62251  ORF Transcript_38408/g.62251 Transcript_38408/m.62251 type:complete len:102 (+) Transcript_38408:214-519(+)
MCSILNNCQRSDCSPKDILFFFIKIINDMPNAIMQQSLPGLIRAALNELYYPLNGDGVNTVAVKLDCLKAWTPCQAQAFQLVGWVLASPIQDYGSQLGTIH